MNESFTVRSGRIENRITEFCLKNSALKTTARLGQRETQRQTIARQTAEIEALRKEIERLKSIINGG